MSTPTEDQVRERAAAGDALVAFADAAAQFRASALTAGDALPSTCEYKHEEGVITAATRMVHALEGEARTVGELWQRTARGMQKSRDAAAYLDALDEASP